MERAEMHVLIVDDDAEVVRALCRVLAPLACTLLQASSCAGAERILGTVSVHVLLTDVVLPDGNGCYLAVAATAPRPDLSVVLTSGYERGILEKYGLRDPDVAFVRKPFDVDDLRKCMQDAILPWEQRV